MSISGVGTAQAHQQLQQQVQATKNGSTPNNGVQAKGANNSSKSQTATLIDSAKSGNQAQSTTLQNVTSTQSALAGAFSILA